MAAYGQSPEEIRYPTGRPNARKWERYLERTHSKAFSTAISSGPLPCSPPTETIQS